MAWLMEDLPWLPARSGQDGNVMDSLTWTPRHDSFVLAPEVARRRRESRRVETQMEVRSRRGLSPP